MYLRALRLPPLEVRAALQDAVVGSAPADGRPSKSRFPWLRSTASPVPSSGACAFSCLPLNDMAIELTQSGFVDPTEARRLQDRLAEVAAVRPAPLVWIQGAARIDPATGLHCVDLAGDLDGLQHLFHSIHTAVRGLGFFQDRRTLRMTVPVARATVDDGHVLSALDSFRSEPWSITTISLARRVFAAGTVETEVFAEVAVGH